MILKQSILYDSERYSIISNTFQRFSTNEALTSIAYKKELRSDSRTLLTGRIATLL